MSGKVGRKDFKILFGGDDSDEEHSHSKARNIELDNTFNESSEYHKKDKHKNRGNRNEHRQKNKEQEGESSYERKRNNHAEEEIGTKKRKSDYNIKQNESSDKIENASIELDVSTNLEKQERLNADDHEEVKINQNGQSLKKQKLGKTEVGGLVVKLLTPAYVERRFESRELFKSLARTISHALADKSEQEITDYVKDFLRKNQEITSQTVL